MKPAVSLKRGKKLYSIAIIMLSIVAIYTALFCRQVFATQPPPPQYYTLTVTKSGGDDTCEVRIELPTASDWTTTSVQESYLSGTEYEPAHQILCPSGYKFSHWESNDEDLDWWTENHAGSFTLTQNTAAVAVFVAVDVPTNETTIWHDHTQPPHTGDVYWHQVAGSSGSMTGQIINEDFLTSEIDTSACSMTLDTQAKLAMQTSWDGDWAIDSNNYRKQMDGEPTYAKYDAHGFNPDLTPWNQILPNEIFKITQRIRVKGSCLSENNVGPWFATHPIEFKVIYNAQTQKRETFAKKSGVQGSSDPTW